MSTQMSKPTNNDLFISDILTGKLGRHQTKKARNNYLEFYATLNFLKYSFGVRPVIFLKYLLKEVFELKPACKASA